MPEDLLLEIGTEELPASFVARALDALPSLATRMLGELRLDHGVVRSLGTPRRLTLIVEGVSDRQPDLREEAVGPPKSVAFGPDGALTRAGEAFARKLGKTAADVSIVTTPKGEYIAVTREQTGEPAPSVLPAALVRLCTQIPFPKTMRWGKGDFAFGRPIHWIVSLFGSDVVPLEIAGVRSARATRGHRFLAPEEVAIAAPAEYVSTLRAAHVLVDPEERRRNMMSALHAVASAVDGQLVEDDGLADECLSLVEEPHALAGSFEPSFLDLPEEVIVAVMRGHQRYFAARSAATGKLLPRYLCVLNNPGDPDTIRRGNDNVMRARLADARFFIDEDRKATLESRLSKLEGVIYQAKLGTVRERVARLEQLAVTIGQTAGVEQAEIARARQAARLAKTDLVTLIVGEFPELQGVTGRWYALAEGIDRRVADAIRDHYLPRGASDDLPLDPVAALVAVADRIDALVGSIGVGLIPTGSADPFALRRAALGTIRIALEGPLDVDVKSAVHAAHDLYEGKRLAPREEVATRIDEFFRARLRAFYAEHFRGDLVEACLAAWGGGSIRDMEARVRAVDELRQMPEFESLAIAFKRTFNIAKDAPAGEVDAAALVEPAETVLAERFNALRGLLEEAIARGDYRSALVTVARELREPIDRFFETVFVMVEDARVRENRLRLVGAISKTLIRIAHFNLLTTPS